MKIIVFFGKFSFSKLRFSFLQKLQRVSIGSKLFIGGVVWQKEHSLSDTQRGKISDDIGTGMSFPQSVEAKLCYLLFNESTIITT
jgi:hypothetical protein